jgi:hypothetical protein
VGTYRHCLTRYAVATADAVAVDSGWVYSSSKPLPFARIARMSNVPLLFGVSFCSPYSSLPAWPQLPPAPSPPA